MKSYSFFILFIFCGILVSGQSSIYGKVTDKKTGEELIYANIVLIKNGVFATGGTTDFEGNYSIPLDPGTYEVKISYTGYPDREITGVIIKGGQGTKLDILMEFRVEAIIWCGGITSYKIPLIEQENTVTGNAITSEQIRNKPNKDINQLLFIIPWSFYQ